MPLTLTKFMLPAAAALAAGTIGTIVFISQQPQPQLDEFSCPANEQAPSHAILLVDVTDRLAAPQAGRLIQTAEDVARSIPRQGRLSVYLLSPQSPWEPQQVLSLCSPGRADETDPWSETGSMFEAAWRNRFIAPLEAAVAQLGDQPASEASPIIESLSAITSGRDFDTDAPGRRLVYIGDGLQHTPGIYSHYGASDLIQAYETSSLSGDAEADYSSASIEIHYLRRPEAAHIQGTDHKAFWRWWFETHGTTDITIRGS